MEKPSQGSQDFTPDQPPSQSSSSLNGLQRTASELRQRFVDAAAGIGRQASHASQQASRALQGLGEQMASISRGDNGAKGGKGAKISVEGVEGQLQSLVHELLPLRAGQSYTVKDVENAVSQVFASGFFSSARPVASRQKGKDAFNIAVQVQPNPVLQGVVAVGADALPTSLIQDVFAGQCGNIVNFGLFGQALKRLDRWYQDRGVFGQVANVRLNKNNIAELWLVEMPVSKVKLAFRDRDTRQLQDKSNTDPQYLQRHLLTRPGQVFTLKQAADDTSALYRTGLFEDVDILPSPAEGTDSDPPAVDVLVSLAEKQNVGLSGGGGFKQGEGLGGLFGMGSFSLRNVRGQGQQLKGSVEVGQEERILSVSFVDPWLGGNRHMLSQRVELLNNRLPLAATHGGSPASTDGDWMGMTLHKTICGAEWAMPLRQDCQGRVGIQWQKATCKAPGGEGVTQDGFDCALTWSGAATDESLRATAAAALVQPASIAEFRLEQGLPARAGWPVATRLQARAAQASPIMPRGLHGIASVQGGAVFGDLPPHEASPIGGVNSVRGYSEGAVGTGRHFVIASGELRLPVPVKEGGVQAVAFVDYGSDLGSGASIRGNPAGSRHKPGQGYGCGIGLRIDTPLGPLRLEYAVNDQHQKGPFFAIGKPTLL